MRAEEFEAELCCCALRAARAKNVDDVAIGQRHLAHVLDHADDFDVDLVEHLESLARILKGNARTCRHDDSAGQRNRLDERDHDIAGARRQIDDEEVELAPLDLLQELSDDLVQHGAAHDHGLVAGRDQADRDELHAV